MKIVFWGTPSYAVPILNSIINSNHDVVAIVTQPDKRRGRGKSLSASPVKQLGLNSGIRIFTPENIRKQEDIQNEIEGIGADIYIVVAFGQILPVEVLNQPPLGCWNIHASLLPNWRGAAPINWSIVTGDVTTGVAIMAMEQGLDTGPILIQRSIKIGLTENAHQLSSRLSNLSSDLILESLDKINEIGPGTQEDRYNKLNLISQDKLNRRVRYARQIRKEDYEVNWNESAINIHRKIMGFYPNLFTSWRGKRLKLLNSIPLVESYKDYLIGLKETLIIKPQTAQAGHITSIVKNTGIIVSTGEAEILITEGQIEGKKPAKSLQFLQQLNPTTKDRFQ